VEAAYPIVPDVYISSARYYRFRAKQSLGILNISKIMKVCDFNSKERSPFAWLYRVILKRDFDVSDLRDHIIGILGLVDEKPTRTIEPFRPDCTTPMHIGCKGLVGQYQRSHALLFGKLTRFVMDCKERF
jgi:hypothetical protein